MGHNIKDLDRKSNQFYSSSIFTTNKHYDLGWEGGRAGSEFSNEGFGPYELQVYLLYLILLNI